MVLSLVVASFIFGCSGDDGDVSTEFTRTDLVVAAEKFGLGIEDVERLDPVQRAAISDGFVTRAEYEAAVQSGADCVAADGWEVTELRVDPISDRVAFAISHGPGVFNSEVDAQTDVSTDKCYARHIDPIETGYYISIAPTGDERDEQILSLIECLNSADITEIEPDFTAEQFVKAISDKHPDDVDDMIPGLNCMDAHQSLFMN